MTRTAFTLALLGAAALSTPTRAATVSVSNSVSSPSPAAIGAGVPATSRIYSFFLTSDADVLAIDRVGILGEDMFQVPAPFGNNLEPPPEAFILLNPALEADSWISTPGNTSRLGPDLPGDGNLTTFGDLTNDGPQTNFKFAQLTFPNDQGTWFNFRIQLAGATGPEAFLFSLPILIPEPSSVALASLGLMGAVAAGRRRK